MDRRTDHFLIINHSSQALRMKSKCHWSPYKVTLQIRVRARSYSKLQRCDCSKVLTRNGNVWLRLPFYKLPRSSDSGELQTNRQQVNMFRQIIHIGLIKNRYMIRIGLYCFSSLPFETAIIFSFIYVITLQLFSKITRGSLEKVSHSATCHAISILSTI